MRNEDLLMKELVALRDTLAPIFNNKLQWEIEHFPLMGLSEFPYTLVELVPRKGLARLLGRKHVDLLGFNGGECVFYNPPPRLVLLSDSLKRVIDPQLLKEFAQNIGNICSTHISIQNL